MIYRQSMTSAFIIIIIIRRRRRCSRVFEQRVRRFERELTTGAAHFVDDAKHEMLDGLEQQTTDKSIAIQNQIYISPSCAHTNTNRHTNRREIEFRPRRTYDARF